MASDEPEESEELRAFREQWRAEVQHKHLHHEQDHPEAGPTASTGPKHNPAHDPPSTGTAHALAKQRRALDIYRDAIRHEQASELDLALRLYRQAFKLDSDVDRAFMRAEGYELYSGPAPAHHSTATHSTAQTISASKAPDAHGIHTDKQPSHKPAGVDGIIGGMDAVTISTGAVIHQTHVDRTLSAVLASLLGDFPDALSFSPEIESEPVPLEMLPDELIVLMLSYLDPTAMERFASISKKARVLTLDTTLWRPLVCAIYKPPQIPRDEGIADILNLYDDDYRRTYIEHPRVRLDGVYIAVNQYIRPGLSENRWVNVSHLITYHRYLRFYPSGQVISLLANEDQEPQHVINILKPSLRMKGFYIGTWRLEGTTIYIQNLADPAVPDARHTFQMTLQLRSRPLGRWNRLDFREYESVSVGDGEVIPLPLKKERPFWFSKVRSYAYA